MVELKTITEESDIDHSIFYKVTCQAIYDKILQFEKTEKHGLNGFILLLHIGVDPKRTDKFYNRLDALLTELERRGYTFERF